MSGVSVAVFAVAPIALLCSCWVMCSYYNVRRKQARRDEVKDRLNELYSERIARARESGSPIRGPGGAAASITARDSGDRDSDKDSAYAASQAAMGTQIRTVDEGQEGTGRSELPSMAVRATARARGHGETRATVDGDADPEDVEVAVTQPRGSRSTRSMV